MHLRRTSPALPALWALLLVMGCTTQTGTQASADAGDIQANLILAAPERGFQVQTAGVLIEPGEDIRWCEVLQLPGPLGQPYDVNRIELAMTDHGRDLIVSAAAPGSATAEIMDVGARVPCSRAGEAFGEELQDVSVSQDGYLDLRYPEEVGKRLFGGQKIAVNYHFANDSSEVVAAQAKLNFHLTDQLQYVARTASFDNFTIYTPPGGWSSHLAECRVSQDMVIGELVRRTEQHGTRFSVWRAGGPQDGELIWTSRDYRDNRFEPVETLELAAGEGLRFQCDYVNTSGADLRYGVTAMDERCGLNAIWWSEAPLPDSPEGCLLFEVGADGIARP